MIISRVTIIILLCHFLSVQAWAKWPDVPAPKKARLKVVADNMVFNGVAMKSWEIVSWEPRSQTLEFYKAAWEVPVYDGAPGFIEYKLDGWYVISRLQEDYQITVQLDDSEAETTRGLIGISQLPANRELPAMGGGFPKIGNMQFINDIRAVDQNKRSRTIVASTDASVKSSVKHYRRTYRRKGWEELTQNFEYEGQENFALMFSRRGKELNLSITRKNRKTNIVAVLVDY